MKVRDSNMSWRINVTSPSDFPQAEQDVCIKPSPVAMTQGRKDWSGSCCEFSGFTFPENPQVETWKNMKHEAVLSVSVGGDRLSGCWQTHVVLRTQSPGGLNCRSATSPAGLCLCGNTTRLQLHWSSVINRLNMCPGVSVVESTCSYKLCHQQLRLYCVVSSAAAAGKYSSSSSSSHLSCTSGSHQPAPLRWQKWSWNLKPEPSEAGFTEVKSDQSVSPFIVFGFSLCRIQVFTQASTCFCSGYWVQLWGSVYDDDCSYQFQLWQFLCSVE